MRNLIIILIVSLMSVSCKKEMQAPTTILNEGVDTAIAMLKYSGVFMAGPYGTATGKAEVYKTGSKYEVRLADFMVNNGPALHVYLSKEAMPINFIDAGQLKSTNGNQVYQIPDMPDFLSYKYISIHCVAYNHLFGYALLK